MPRSMGSEESESSESSSESSSSEFSSSESSSSEERHNCSSCRDTGYRWVGHGYGYRQGTDLNYCTCPRGFAKEMEKIEVLPDIDMARYLPTDRVVCKECLKIFDYSGEGVYVYVINPKDYLPLVTCRECLIKPGLPPIDIVSVYHNRRKLRIRKR